MRYLMLCVLTVLVSGCALPASLQIVSWAVSGFSYATTGKSLSDHAVSAVVAKDCALHRIALGEDICNPVEADGIAVAENTLTPVVEAEPDPTKRLRNSLIALAETLDEDIQPASFDENATPPLNSALLAMAATLNKLDRNKGPSVSPNETGGKHYLVIGQYRVLQEAEDIKSRHSALGTKLRMILKDGVLLYQVTAGPFERPKADGLEAKLDNSGLSTRVALLCEDGVTPAPCHGDGTQLTIRSTEQITSAR
jgi:hypothetical protein